jgi:hypothetical protein
MASTPHRIEISGLRLRRAVVGVLLLHPGAASVDRVIELLAHHGLEPFTLPIDGGRTGRKRVIDVLAYQARLGRLRRVSPGVYVVEPTAMTPSMRSRCRSAVRSDSDRDRGERIVLEHRAPASLDEFDLLGPDPGDA